jgi:hypothetical protein
MATIFEDEGRERRKRERLKLVKILVYLAFVILPFFIKKEGRGRLLRAEVQFASGNFVTCRVEEPIRSSQLHVELYSASEDKKVAVCPMSDIRMMSVYVERKEKSGKERQGDKGKKGKKGEKEGKGVRLVVCEKENPSLYYLRAEGRHAMSLEKREKYWIETDSTLRDEKVTRVYVALEGDVGRVIYQGVRSNGKYDAEERKAFIARAAETFKRDTVLRRRIERWEFSIGDIDKIVQMYEPGEGVGDE